MATAKVMSKNFVQVSTNYDTIDNLTDILMTNDECEDTIDTGQHRVTNDLIEVANCLLTLIVDGRMLVAFNNLQYNENNNNNANSSDQNMSICKTGVIGGGGGTNGVGIHANILIDKLIENLKMSVKQQQNEHGWANGQLMSTSMTQLIKHTNNFYNSHHVCSFKNFVQVIYKIYFINWSNLSSFRQLIFSSFYKFFFSL